MTGTLDEMDRAALRSEERLQPRRLDVALEQLIRGAGDDKQRRLEGGPSRSSILKLSAAILKVR